MIYFLVQWRKSVYSMLLQHAAYSVDTFFFLSGLLLVVIALRAMERCVYVHKVSKSML